MKAFSAMLTEWFGRTGLSSADAANVLGCAVVTFRGWLAGRSEPDYFTKCAVVRQMRDGHDLLSDVRMSPVNSPMRSSAGERSTGSRSARRLRRLTPARKSSVDGSRRTEFPVSLRLAKYSAGCVCPWTLNW